jgi:putative RecB family exonuclease
MDALIPAPDEPMSLEATRDGQSLASEGYQPALAGMPDVPPADEAARLAAFLQGATRLLDGYFAVEDPTRLEPAEREALVSTLVDDELLIRGYIDRLDISPAGDLRVVDYKTGRAPGEGFEAKALFQLKFYALVLWRLRGRRPDLLQLVYLGSGEVLRYVPDEADLLATERKVRAVWDAIALAARTGDWQPSPGRRCSWCDHHALCPTRGGTPPPLPRDAELKVLGLSSEETGRPGLDDEA